MLPMTDKEQSSIRFENMMADDQTSWWPPSKDKDGKIYLSLGTVLHFIYVYGNFNMAETCTVGSGKVNYQGEEVATFEMSEKYKIPVFKFIDKYKYMTENQEILLRGIDDGLHIEWRKKFEHLKEILKINF
jgi:hypothetical protein